MVIDIIIKINSNKNTNNNSINKLNKILKPRVKNQKNNIERIKIRNLISPNNILCNDTLFKEFIILNSSCLYIIKQYFINNINIDNNNNNLKKNSLNCLK